MILSRRQVLAGVASLAATPVCASDAPPSAASLAQPVAQPRTISGLDITDEAGAPVLAEAWRGRWVILNLWAPWCLPCRREMPSIENLSRQLDPERFAVVPLAFEWRGPIWVNKFYREVGITDLPIYLGDGENVDAVLGLSNLPTTAIVNPQGQHAFTVAGEARWDDSETLAWLRAL